MSDYPKLLYRSGTGIGHMLGDKPLKVENKYLVDLMTVESEDAELAALDDGWHPSAEAACAVKPDPVVDLPAKPETAKTTEPKPTEKAA